MLCVCNFFKPIKGYILRMIRKARLVRATVDVHISSVYPKMIFANFEALTGPPLQYLLNCKVFVLILFINQAQKAKRDLRKERPVNQDSLEY